MGNVIFFILCLMSASLCCAISQQKLRNNNDNLALAYCFLTYAWVALSMFVAFRIWGK